MPLIHKSRAHRYASRRARATNPFGLEGNTPYVLGGALLLAGLLYLSRSKDRTKGLRFYGLKGSKDPFFEGRYVISFDSGKSLVLYDSGKVELVEPSEVVPAGEGSRVFDFFSSTSSNRPMQVASDGEMYIYSIRSLDNKDFAFLRVSPNRDPASGDPNAYAEIFSRSVETQAILEPISLKRFLSILFGNDPKWAVARKK